MADRRLSSAEIFELQANKRQFSEWNENEPEVDFVNHAKVAALAAINQELTEVQKRYYIMYHLDGISIPKIAELEGVNRSTVSRTLTRASKKLARILRYAAPPPNECAATNEKQEGKLWRVRISHFARMTAAHIPSASGT